MRFATPRYRAHENAPAEGVYVAVDRSGEVLGMGVRRRKGEELPELVAADSDPVGYVRVGEVETTARAV
jgi:hypothetical protein